MTEPDPTSTLLEVEHWLSENIEAGVHCPACKQFAKIYRRKISGASVRALAALYRATRDGNYAHWPTVLGRKQADEAKLVHWGLVLEATEERPDGGRAGYWRITELGRRWLHGETTVPKYVSLYDGRFLSFDGDEVTARQCLGVAFDLAELMGWDA